MEDILPNGRPILKQLGFKRGGTCASTKAETKEFFVELNPLRQMETQNPCHHLLQTL